MYSDRFFPLTIGAEALRTADRRSAFFGVRSDPGTPPGRHRVRHEGRAVGRLTAAARSPHLQSTIGYVRFDSPREWEGEQVSLEAADGTLYPGPGGRAAFLRRGEAHTARSRRCASLKVEHD